MVFTQDEIRELSTAIYTSRQAIRQLQYKKASHLLTTTNDQTEAIRDLITAERAKIDAILRLSQVFLIGLS